MKFKGVYLKGETWLDHQDVDYHIWLDTDIIFDERTLTYLENKSRTIR